MVPYLIKRNFWVPAIFIIFCLVNNNDANADSAVFACKTNSSREFTTVSFDSESKAGTLPRRGAALDQRCAKTIEEVTSTGCEFFDFTVKLVESAGNSKTFTSKSNQGRSSEVWKESGSFKTANSPLVVFVATGCGTAKPLSQP